MSEPPSLVLYHCFDARSLRVLWALYEMRLSHTLINLPFPPRVFEKSFLQENPLGTVPLLKDGPVRMTESSAICLYLAERYCPTLLVPPDHERRALFLNLLFQSDATFTFPLALMLRYTQMEAHRGLQVVGEDYRKWFLARIRALEPLLDGGGSYLCGQAFTVADICVGYALYLGHTLGLSADYATPTRLYLERLMARPAFLAAQAAQSAPAKPAKL